MPSLTHWITRDRWSQNWLPPALQEFGLLEGFEWLAEQMKNHGLTVTVHKHVQDVVLGRIRPCWCFQRVNCCSTCSNMPERIRRPWTIDRNSDGHLVVSVKR